MKEKEIKAIDCMIRHLQTYFEQSGEQRIANFAEPCGECKHFKECGCDWLRTMEPVIRYGTETMKLAKLPKWVNVLGTKEIYTRFEHAGKNYMVAIKLIKYKSEHGIWWVKAFQEKEGDTLEEISPIKLKVHVNRS